MNLTIASRWGIAFALVVAMLFFPMSVNAGPKWYRLNQDVAVGGGASAFTDLTDTPGTITASKPVYGNVGGTALEFGTDDDVPEAGDFGAATDLDANGALNTDSVGDNEIDYTEVTITDFDGTAWRMLYIDGSGDVQEVALGADDTVLTSTGAASAPGFEAAAAGGDITDVWGCSTGDCQTLTAGGSDALDGTSASYMIPWVVTTDCSAVIAEGRACWDSDDDNVYVGDGAAAKSWAASGDVTGVGDCASGACLDGSSDGGSTFSVYDGDSHKGIFAMADLSADRTYTFPDSTGTVVLSTTDDDVPESGDFGNAAALTATGAIDTAYIQDYMIDWTDVTLLDFDYQNPWMMFYSDGSGDVVELAFGTSGYVLTSNGATAAPTWTLTSTGDVTMVGECTSGDCFDGSTDGGNYLRFTDDGSYYTTLQAATGLGGNITITMPGASGTLITSGSDDDIPESGEGDFADAVDLEADGSLSNDVVAAAEMADGDFGDWSCSGGSCTLDADVVASAEIGDDQIDSEHYVAASIDAEHLAPDIIDETKIADNGIDSEHYNDGSVDPVHLADDDFGDWTCSSGTCTLDADVVAAAEMADADHGDVSWSGGVATVDPFTSVQFVVKTLSADLDNEYALSTGTGLVSSYGGAPPDATWSITCAEATTSTPGCAHFNDVGNITITDEGDHSNISLTLAAGDTYTNFGDAADDTLDELFDAIDTALGSSSHSAAGSDTYVQYNNSGSFGAEANFSYDDSTNELDLYDEADHGVMRITSYSDTGSHRGLLYLRGADGTQASPGAIETNDGLGSFMFAGYTGAGWSNAATISAWASENWDGSNNGAFIRVEVMADGTTVAHSVVDFDGSDGIVAWEPIHIRGTPTADDKYSGIVIDDISAGEAISQWDLVYMDDTENEWMKADANAAGKFPAVGMAIEACSDGSECRILIQGVVRNAGWAATITGEGKAIYLSETAGGITETQPSDAGDCVQHIGRTLNDTNSVIYVNPSLLWVEIGS